MAFAPTSAERGWLSRRRIGRLAALLVAVHLIATAADDKATMPRFKWGQGKDQIYLSVIIRDLDKGSVTASLPSAGEFSFRAKDESGEEFALDLELREDVKTEESLTWEIGARPDRFGTAVFFIFNKVNQHLWDLLVMNPKPYKKVMDKDWTREDDALEPEEEVAYVEDNSQYVIALTPKNKQKLIEKFSTLLVNVRYPWCSECKSQDDAFVEAAKLAKARGKKDKAWKKVAFGVVDAREEKKLGKELGAKCDESCEYLVYTGPKEEPLTLKSTWAEQELIESLEKFLGPAYQVLKERSEVEPLREKDATCLGKFASEASPEFTLFKRVAGWMRGELAFAAIFGETAPLEVWPHKQNFSFKFDGTWEDHGFALRDWIRPRSIPLLQEYDWQMKEKYEKLELPLAKVFLDDTDKNPSLDKIVRYVVRRVAKQFIGKIAFVEHKKSVDSSELRDFGLNQPEVYPAFAIASNASVESIKYGFEVSADVAESTDAFWSDADKAVSKLTSFCEQVLAGKWPEAHESEAPDTTWTKGTVKNIVWKTYNEIRAPEKPLLLEMYGKYRPDDVSKMMETQHLASAFEPMSDSMTVARYDASENYLPPGDFKRDKFSTDTEWYWVPAKPSDAERPPIKKLTKHKTDAPMEDVVEFAAAQMGDSLNIEDTMERFDQFMEDDPPPEKTPTMAPVTMDQMGMGMGGGDLGAMGLSSDMARNLGISDPGKGRKDEL